MAQKKNFRDARVHDEAGHESHLLRQTKSPNPVGIFSFGKIMEDSNRLCRAATGADEAVKPRRDSAEGAERIPPSPPKEP